MLGSSNDGEHEVARRKLNKILAANGCTWNDLPAILAAIEPTTGTAGAASTHNPSSAVNKPTDSVNVLDLMKDYPARTARTA